MKEMVLNAYTSQKEPKGINETHLFAQNLRFQRGEVGAGEMDATYVAGGISGRVKLGFSLLTSPPNQESRQLRRLDASRSDQLGHEVKNYYYLRFPREFTTEMLSFTLVW